MHLLSSFDKYELKHTFRENNGMTILSKLVSSKKFRQRKTFIQDTLTTWGMDTLNIFANQIGSNSWMSPIWNYTVNDLLLEDENEAKKVKLKSTHYAIIDGEVFRRGISAPLLKCLKDNEA